MSDHEELIQALAQLDPATLEVVVNTAYRQRYKTLAVAQPEPSPQATRDEYANWLAHRHLSSDAALDLVVYLPAGVEDEIHLLEVNRLLNISDSDVIEPLDFSPDTDLRFKIFVADVTTDQWERIKGPSDSILPSGWNLTDHKIFRRP